MAGEGKDYVVGKGKVYFNPFVPGSKTPTSERYLGNTPELSTSSDEETLDHYDADSGLNVKDESVTIEKNVTGSLVTDNISIENVAMFFGGDIDDLTIAAAVGLTETIPAKRGRWFQLGTSDNNPAGVRHITNLTMKKGVTVVPLLNNAEVDLALARVYIEPDAPGIADDDPIIYTYDVEASTRSIVIGAGTEVRGSLRFISANPIGSQKDFYWPYVKLSANGDFALKSDEWLQIPFSFEVLKLDENTERVYITNRGLVT